MRNCLLAVFLVMAALVNRAWAESIEVSLEHQGRTRYCLVDKPSGPSPWPLLLNLHGGGGNPEIAQESTGFTREALSNGIMVAYAAGSGRFQRHLLTWNVDNCCGYSHEEQVDDTGFLIKLIDLLVAEHGVDPDRVFVSGMSNGGMMTQRMGCQASDKIRGIISVAGALNETWCQPVRPVSALIIHGTADKHVLYEGGPPEINLDRNPRVDNSVAYAVEHWRTVNQCSDQAGRTREGSAVVDEYMDCGSGGLVELVTVIGGGHVWPGGKKFRRKGDDPKVGWGANPEVIEFVLRNGQGSNSGHAQK